VHSTRRGLGGNTLRAGTRECAETPLPPFVPPLRGKEHFKPDVLRLLRSQILNAIHTSRREPVHQLTTAWIRHPLQQPLSPKARQVAIERAAIGPGLDLPAYLVRG
jgi:hypothetical protein